ncbi:hypothetical protein [Nonomuraea sp. NPDC050643]|uniref:hypothetical protein n=1 Tax=Nonomuraea sp. NPDC050643 TaxID=3155660 RepID=UPI0033C27CE8
MIETVTAHSDGAVSLRWEAEDDEERRWLGHIPRLLVRREDPHTLDFDLRKAHKRLLAGEDLPTDETRRLLERALNFLLAQP